MKSLAIVEIIFVLIMVIGIVIIYRDKELNRTQKLLWTVAILIFNILALICFFVWKSAKK
ncbi:MAG: PLDc N-terminal domain-containing protein [Prevotellaceae bacterium]|jgi:hypothetical protein|nr:PLDc N-terminal domain-containing protein [Prevotellaceae bacterium]